MTIKRITPDSQVRKFPPFGTAGKLMRLTFGKESVCIFFPEIELLFVIIKPAM